MSEPTLTEEGREGFRFDPLARRLLLLSHTEDTVRNLEGLIDEQRAEAAAAERERWVDALSPLCDDEWLRLRDRAMDMPDTKTHQWMRRGSSAWERAAHDVRGVLNDLADYEDQYVDQHAAYMRWLRDGRDRAAVAQGREDAR